MMLCTKGGLNDTGDRKRGRKEEGGMHEERLHASTFCQFSSSRQEKEQKYQSDEDDDVIRGGSFTSSEKPGKLTFQ